MTFYFIIMTRLKIRFFLSITFYVIIFYFLNVIKKSITSVRISSCLNFDLSHNSELVS